MTKKSRTNQIAGVDYGSKLAGTTVIAHLNDRNEITFSESEKKKDADLFLKKYILKSDFRQIFIDAPLSLPGVYHLGPPYEDYFFRKGDKALSAMSPMFLGGLTARAMKLKSSLEKENIKVFEIYPAAFVKLLDLKKLNYKKQLKHLVEVIDCLEAEISFPIIKSEIKSWHHVDALMAFQIGWRYLNNLNETYGDAKEGQILV